MDEIKLHEETISKLAYEIVKRFFQHIEKALIQGEEVSLLGLLLKDYLDEVQRKHLAKARPSEHDREERLFKTLSNTDRYIRPLSVEYIKGKEIQKPITWKKRETL